MSRSNLVFKLAIFYIFVILFYVQETTPTSCKLDFIHCNSTDYCQDFLCSNLDTFFCFNDTFVNQCDLKIRVELAFSKILENSTGVAILSRFLDLNENNVIRNANESGLEVSKIDKDYYSNDGPYALLVSVQQKSLKALIELVENRSSLFIGNLIENLQFSDFNIFPSVSSLSIETETPAELSPLQIKTIFLKNPRYLSFGLFWNLNGSLIPENFYQTSSVGFNFFESIVLFPAAEVSAELTGDYLFAIWQEDSRRNRFSDFETTKIQVRTVPRLKLEVENLFFIGYSDNQSYCCDVIRSEEVPHLTNENTAVFFEPNRAGNVIKNEHFADNARLCFELEFKEEFSGNLTCSHSYWAGKVSDSIEVTVEIPKEKFFCPEETNFGLTWDKTLSLPTKNVTAMQSCGSLLFGEVEKTCFRDSESNSGFWMETNDVKCFSVELLDSDCFNNTYLISESDKVNECLQNLADFFDRNQATRSGNIKRAFDFLSDVNFITAQLDSIDPTYGATLYNRYLGVISSLLSVNNSGSWEHLKRFSAYSYYSNFQSMNSFSELFLKLWPWFNVTVTNSTNGYENWVVFKQEVTTNLTIEAELTSFSVHFEYVSQGLVTIFGADSINKTTLFDQYKLEPSFWIMTSDAGGLFTFNFTQKYQNLPVCVQLTTDLTWITENCITRVDADAISCTCQGDIPVFAAIYQEDSASENKTDDKSVPLQVVKLVCLVITIILFLVTIYLMLRVFRPTNGRTFALCQFSSAQTVASLLNVVFFASEIKLSPSFCLAVSVFFKFFTVYSFMWIAYEAKYTRFRLKRKALKVTNSDEGVKRKPKRVFTIFTIVSIVTSIAVSAVSETLQSIFDDEYPPVFADGTCDLTNRNLTLLTASTSSVIVGLFYYLTLLWKIKTKYIGPEYSPIHGLLKRYFRISVFWMAAIFYPCVVFSFGSRLLADYFWHEVSTCISSLAMISLPCILIGYTKRLNGEQKRTAKNEQENEANFSDLSQVPEAEQVYSNNQNNKKTTEDEIDREEVPSANGGQSGLEDCNDQ